MKPHTRLRYSFIIPALNEARHIARCITAIQSQIGENAEIIVADNGSHDKTVKTARTLGATIVYVSQKGLSHARNYGAKKARGEILCFIDADGIAANNWLQILEQTLNKAEYDYVSGLNIFVHKRLYKFLLYNSYTFLVFGLVWLADRIFGKTQLVGNNMAIKKTVFDSLGGFPPIVAEDVFLTRKIWHLKKYRGTFIPRMLVRYDSRGFDSAGFLRTIWYWIKCALRPTSQEHYAYNSKR